MVINIKFLFKFFIFPRNHYVKDQQNIKKEWGYSLTYS